jgi:Cu2+-exporting ATPase
MLTETAAIKLKLLDEESTSVAESLARRLSECGFPTKKRESGLGVAENVRKWKELVKKKEELLAKSRNRVAFAWTLVALCCGSHASHIFHSLGIHISHGNVQIKYAILSAFCNQIQRLKPNFVLSFSSCRNVLGNSS